MEKDKSGQHAEKRYAFAFEHAIKARATELVPFREDSRPLIHQRCIKSMEALANTRRGSCSS
jgi:hypothetical protein